MSNTKTTFYPGYPLTEFVKDSREAQTPKKTLVEIAFQFEAIMDEIANSEGEISTEMEEALKSSDLEFAKKIDAYGHCDSRMTQEIEYLKKKADTLYARAKRIEAAQDRMKDVLKSVMVAMELKKAQGEDYSFTLSLTKAKVVVTDEAQLPRGYFKEEVVTKLSKDALREALEAGVSVSGARLEQSYSLRKGVK